MEYESEDPYIESEIEENFIEWYEFEGVRKIAELSRQVRTLLNFKTETMKYRFRSNEKFTIKNINTNFLTAKHKFESLALKYITLLRRIKEDAGTLEEGIQSLYFKAEKSRLKQLKEITGQIFIQIHYFSEESLHEHPLFLKLLIKFVQEGCMAKKYIDKQFSKFYEELNMNYFNLEKELDILIPNKIEEGKIRKKKQYNEAFTS